MSETTVDTELIEFAVRWYRYPADVGDEELYPRFGISPAVYRRRLWYALNLPNASLVDESTRARLLDYARPYTTGASRPSDR